MRIPSWTRVPLVAAATGATLIVVLAGPAAAHVTVHTDNPTQGASDAVLSFQVPNEQDSATVTRLQVQLPTKPPLLGVLVRPHPGWTSTVTTVPLNPPVTTDDGPVNEAVAQITWTAASPSAAIPAGGYDEFDLAVGQLPTSPALTFKAVQTYSNGQVARWIAPTVTGQPAPEDPAPVLRLNPVGTTTTTTSSPPAAAAAGSTGGTSSSVPAATTVIDTSRDTTARVIAAIALVLALVGTTGGFLAGRRRRVIGPEPPEREPDPATSAGGTTHTLSRFAPGWRDADRTARTLLAVAAGGALAVAVAAFLPWVDGALSDRGAALLTVHKAGITNPLRGRWTLLLAGAALALIAMLAARPAWPARGLILAVVGLGVVAVALSGRHDGASVARDLIHHKIGTGEIVNPTADYTTGYGWWITVVGGFVIAATAAGWFAHARQAGIRPEPNAPRPLTQVSSTR